MQYSVAANLTNFFIDWYFLNLRGESLTLMNVASNTELSEDQAAQNPTF